MTSNRDLKSRIRERQGRTGESYSTARLHVLQARDRLLGVPAVEATAALPETVEAVVLKVNERSARLRLLTDGTQVTFRSSLLGVAPGQVVTAKLTKRWTWHDDAYASGDLVDLRFDLAKLGLPPLPLELVFARDDLREGHEPFRRPDPYAPLWRKLTAKRRDVFEFDAIAWGAFPGETEATHGSPNADAMDLLERGDLDGARTVWMDLLLRDLRCLDAHAGLGTIAFTDSAQSALVHYEIGVRIGELSAPSSFEGVLPWGHLYNRPFLRCLKGYALCLWRLGRTVEALATFERLLALNPNDNQGNRICWQYLRDGRTWEDLERDEGAEGAEANESLH